MHYAIAGDRNRLSFALCAIEWLVDAAAVQIYVLDRLDDASGMPEWQRYLEDSRQLTLF